MCQAAECLHCRDLCEIRPIKPKRRNDARARSVARRQAAYRWKNPNRNGEMEIPVWSGSPASVDFDGKKMGCTRAEGREEGSQGPLRGLLPAPAGLLRCAVSSQRRFALRSPSQRAHAGRLCPFFACLRLST